MSGQWVIVNKHTGKVVGSRVFGSSYIAMRGLNKNTFVPVELKEDLLLNLAEVGVVTRNESILS